MASRSRRPRWWDRVSAQGNMSGPNWKTGRRTAWPASLWLQWASLLFLPLHTPAHLYQRRSRRRTRHAVPAHRRHPPSAACPHHGPGWIVTRSRRHSVHHVGDDDRHVGSPPTPRGHRRALAYTRCALRLECNDRGLDGPNGAATLALPIGTVESDSSHSLIRIIHDGSSRKEGVARDKREVPDLHDV